MRHVLLLIVLMAVARSGAVSAQAAEPDLSGLPKEQREMILLACATSKYLGPAAYYRCLSDQVTSLRSAASPPDLSNLRKKQRELILLACSTSKYLGPAAYYRCLNDQVVALRSAPDAPDLSRVKKSERDMIVLACSTSKYLGPAAYQRCLVDQLAGLGLAIQAVPDEEQATTAQPDTVEPNRPTMPAAQQSHPPSQEEPEATDLATVRTIQQILARLGLYSGRVDGTLGPKTRAAVRAYQGKMSLPADGRLTAATRQALYAEIPPPRQLKLDSSGTGFAINKQGNAVTNFHVVSECTEVRLKVADGAVAKPGNVVATDTQNDLAVLKLSDQFASVATFRAGSSIRSGDNVVALGFPLSGLLATEANVSTGTVSAMAGIQDDPRYLQISAPIQPGNSGGPLLDMSGNVVGVVSSKLDALKVAGVIGDIPQNVNFAIKDDVVRKMLDRRGIAYQTAPSERTFAAADVAETAKSFTILIECWK